MGVSNEETTTLLPTLPPRELAPRSPGEYSWRTLTAIVGKKGLLVLLSVLVTVWLVIANPDSNKHDSAETLAAISPADDAPVGTNKPSPQPPPHGALSSETEPLAFTALNFYHVRDGKPGKDYPWLKNTWLIEPYRETTLAVTKPRAGCSYRWEIRAGASMTGDVVASASGVETVVVLTTLDENVISLVEKEEEEVTAGGRRGLMTVTRRLDEIVMVKYVRREMRTLTEEERGEFFDAVSERKDRAV